MGLRLARAFVSIVTDTTQLRASLNTLQRQTARVLQTVANNAMAAARAIPAAFQAAFRKLPSSFRSTFRFLGRATTQQMIRVFTITSKRVVLKVKRMMRNVVTTIRRGMGRAFLAVQQSFTGQVLGEIGNAFRSIAKGIKRVASGIVHTFTTIAQTVGKVFSQLGRVAVATLTIVVNAVSGLVQTIGSIIASLPHVITIAMTIFGTTVAVTMGIAAAAAGAMAVAVIAAIQTIVPVAEAVFGLLGKLAVQIVEQALNIITAVVSKAFQAIDALIGRLRRAADNARLVATGVLGSIAIFGTRFLKDSQALAGHYEEAEIAFSILLGSMERGQKLLGELKEFARRTPFGFEGAITTTQQLLGMGIQADKVMETLKFLGDVSAGLGVDIQRLALNFGQVKAQARLTGRELKDFAIAGVPLREFLSEIIFGTKEFVDRIDPMVERAEIGFELVEEAFRRMTQEGGRFFNMMEARNATLPGVIDRLRDTIQELQRAIGLDLIDSIKSLLLNIEIFINKTIDLVNKTGKLISFMTAGAVTAAQLGTAVLGAVTAMKFLNISFTDVILGGALAATITAIGAAMGAMAARIRENAKLLKIFTEAWHFFRRAALSVIQQVIDAWKLFVDRNREAFDAIIEMIGNFVHETGRWAVAIAENLALVWELVRNAALTAFHAMRDIVGNFIVLVKDRFMASAVFVQGVWKAMLVALGVGFEALKPVIKTFASELVTLFVETAGVIAGIMRNALLGIFRKEQAERNVKLFAKRIAHIMEQSAEGVAKVGADMSDAFVSEFDKLPAFQDLLGDISLFDFSKMTKLRAGITKLLFSVLQHFKDQVFPAQFELKVFEDDEEIIKVGEGIGRGMSNTFMPILETGLFGIAGLGKSVQEALLKTDDDKQDKMIDLLQRGNQLQEDLIDETREGNKNNNRRIAGGAFQ